MIGSWVSFEHLEESLTLDELYVIANSIQIKEHREYRRLGALQGVDIPELEGPASEDEEEQDDFRARIERRAKEQESQGEGKAPSGLIGTGYQRI